MTLHGMWTATWALSAIVVFALALHAWARFCATRVESEALGAALYFAPLLVLVWALLAVGLS